MHAASEELPWPVAGRLVLGRYEQLGVIGRGGMGVVSKARDVQTGRLVAIKRVRSADARAEREALAAARLQHPAIVELLDAEATDDGWLIISELVEGADLRAVLRAGEVPERDVARFGGSIARALAHAHACGVIHRDVKPANILCPADPRRAGAWAKLTDFGVAQLAGAETLTAVGDVVGTMAYMAPEQARGQRAGAPADTFALAVVVYEALAGVNPRRGSTAAETAARALQSLPPLARFRPDLPAAVHAAIDHCLELDPERRGGLKELDGGLRRLAALHGGARPPEPVAPTAVTRLRDRDQPRPRRTPDPAPSATAVAPGPAHRPAPEPARPQPSPVADPHGHVGPAPLPDPYAQPAGGVRDPYGLGAGEPPAPAAAPRRLPGRGALPRLPLRLLGTAGAAAALWVVTDGASAPVALAGAAAAAFILPRLTWIAIVIAVVAVLVPRDATAAWLAGLTALLPIALLPARGPLWPAGGLAAGFTSVGLPGAWPALSALAPRPWLRVGLAIHGAVVSAATATAVKVPLFVVPKGDVFEVGVLFVLPLAGIWAVAAVLLGLLVRGRTLGADLLLAGAWVAALGFAMVAAGVAEPEPLLWAGPTLAALAVVAARASVRERDLAVQAAPQY